VVIEIGIAIGIDIDIGSIGETSDNDPIPIPIPISISISTGLARAALQELDASAQQPMLGFVPQPSLRGFLHSIWSVGTNAAGTMIKAVGGRDRRFGHLSAISQ